MRKKRWIWGALFFFMVCTPIYAAAQEPIKIRISDLGPVDTKTNSYYLIGKIMGEQLEKNFPGKFKVEYYPSSQLYKSIPAHKAVLGGPSKSATPTMPSSSRFSVMRSVSPFYAR